MSSIICLENYIHHEFGVDVVAEHGLVHGCIARPAQLIHEYLKFRLCYWFAQLVHARV